MGKPKAPAPPDYAAAATAQGTANENAAIAQNFLNQANQVGPYGSMNYTYDYGHGFTLPDGTVIPSATATTTLSPAQQKLLDQQTALSTALNDTAMKGVGYVDKITGKPLDISKSPALQSDGGQVYKTPSIDDFNSTRDKVTNAFMARLQPQMDQQSNALRSQMASQGIELGSKAYGDATFNLDRSQNDQRTSALLAGDTASQNLWQNALAAGQTTFNQGLANDQFANQARNQSIQEGEFLRTEPLNVLNALRTGNQTTLPQFGNVSGGAGIQAAPVYQAANDQYGAAQSAYQNKMAGYSSLLSGLGSIGGAAVMASDRRLKTDVREFAQLSNGLKVYSWLYRWGVRGVGFMADEVARIMPKLLGPEIAGYQTVNYGALNG